MFQVSLGSLMVAALISPDIHVLLLQDLDSIRQALDGLGSKVEVIFHFSDTWQHQECNGDIT